MGMCLLPVTLPLLAITGSRFTSVALASHGCLIELVDNSPTAEWLAATMGQAAEGWDGSDPLRPPTLGRPDLIVLERRCQ